MLVKEKIYDYKYYTSLPEGIRVELIGGQIYNMSPAPSFRHQEISAELFYIIKDYLKAKACKVFHAPFDVYLIDANQNIEDCKNIVQPDISVICDRTKFHSKGCIGAPDFIIEIVSPSTKKNDYMNKLILYVEFGVKEYWIVDPTNETIVVYIINDSNNFSLKSYTFQDTINVSIFNDLYVNFAELDLLTK